MKKLFTLLFILVGITSARAQVVINEYSCSNLNSYQDAYNQYEDWIELYNTSGAVVNLAGYWLSDDANDVQKYQIPAGVTIPANGRRMVFCSDRDIFFSGQIHTSFKLKQTRGEKFIFADPAGNILDSTSLYLTQVGHSRGRTTDGAGTFSLFTTPTPNAANAGAMTGYATKPLFSVAPGNYTTTQNVVISSPDPNVTIYYTTNGTVPTTASTVYAGPVAVSTTTVIKARAFSSTAGIAPSFVETNTYLINETTTMNVVSFTGPFTTLFGGGGGQGILSTLEYFDKAHTFQFEVEGQTRRHGNDSWAYPQKGVRFHVKDETGVAADIDYPLFTTTPRDTYGVVIIKAAGSDNFNGNGGPSMHMRDAFAQTLAQRYNLNMDLRKYEPTIVYINGQYWGVYELRERVDADYTEYYYGQPEKKVDVLRYWGGLNIEYGSDTGWNNLYNYIMTNSMTVQNNYDHVTSFLDVSSFIEYFIFNQYLVNTDWLNWNTMWWRGRKNQGVKWRYALWDEDNILNLGQNYTGVGNTSYNNNPCDPLSLFQNNSSIKHTDMLTRLLQNPDFEYLYKQTWVDMLNGPLKCENILHHFDSIQAIIQPEMQRHCTRWGASFATWQQHAQFTRNELAMRCAVIAGKIDTCLDLQIKNLKWGVSPLNAGTIKMDGANLTPTPGSKLVMADTTHILEAIPAGQYWVFDHWEKVSNLNTYSVNNTDNPVTYDFNEDDSITAVFIYVNPDSIDITFDVDPTGTGTITLNGTTISTYPTTITLDRTQAYSLLATPIASYGLVNWEKKRSTSNFSPNNTAVGVTYTFTEQDTVIAHFQYVPDPDSIWVTFKVDPPGKGEIVLNGSTISSYPYTVKLDRGETYSLFGQATAPLHRFQNWESWQTSSTFTPIDTLEAVNYNFMLTDTVIARFVSYPDPDSIFVTFDVYPPGTGTINLSGRTLPMYPYKIKLDRKNAYDLIARPTFDHKFLNWTKLQMSSIFSPTENDAQVSYKYVDEDSVVAYFDRLPPPVDETIMIPTAFSPNGDGKNDIFRIIPGNDVRDIDLRIVNRFGEVVFQANDIKMGWDGNLKGVPAEVGVYYYSVKVHFENSKGAKSDKLLKGDLTLVR